MKKNEQGISFLDLLKRQVEIPVIQRDYAQGRSGVRTSQIRKTFVSNIIESLMQNRPIHLNFVYGKLRGGQNAETIRRNQDSIENLLSAVKAYARNLDVDVNATVHSQTSTSNFGEESVCFIPLDGQQRLTTLFLLHWYLSCYRKQVAPILYKFTYKTRKSSRDFCRSLVEHTLSVSLGRQLISEVIKDSVWFFTDWKKDPTVAGMLVMLDEIQKQLSHLESKQINGFHKLLFEEQSKIISFDYLNIAEIGAEDELYVKMNSRGKQLTEFENFKSWLLRYATDKELKLLENWDYHLDMDWMDIFWKHKASVSDVDNAYMNLFKRMGQYTLALRIQLEQSKLSAIDSDDLEMLDVDGAKGNNYISFDFYEENKIFDKDNLNELFKFLECVKDDGVDTLEKLLDEYSRRPFFDFLITDGLFKSSRYMSNWHKVTLYSIIKYIIKNGKHVSKYSEMDRISFRDWIRVTQNLIYNSRIDGQQEFVSAIKSIEGLHSHSQDIIGYLSNGNVKIDYFIKIQQEEEILKAVLQAQDAEWSQLFLQYERHHYFFGQIGFLLKYAKAGDKYSKVEFKKYAGKTAELFSKENLERQDFLLHRALLSKGDYLIDKGSGRYSFCLSKTTTARDRDENWRLVFGDEKKSEILRDLLDDNLSLQKIVDQSFKNVIEDWKRLLIEHPECIGYCKQGMIKYEQDGELIRLLGQSQMNHYHAELRSYSFYCKQCKGAEESYIPFKEINYEFVRRADQLAYISFQRLRGFSSLSMDVYCDAENKQYGIYFHITKTSGLAEGVKGVLIANKFSEMNKRWSKYFSTEDKLKRVLKKLCSEFKDL